MHEKQWKGVGKPPLPGIKRDSDLRTNISSAAQHSFVCLSCVRRQFDLNGRCPGVNMTPLVSGLREALALNFQVSVGPFSHTSLGRSQNRCSENFGCWASSAFRMGDANGGDVLKTGAKSFVPALLLNTHKQKRTIFCL